MSVIHFVCRDRSRFGCLRAGVGTWSVHWLLIAARLAIVHDKTAKHDSKLGIRMGSECDRDSARTVWPLDAPSLLLLEPPACAPAAASIVHRQG